MKKTMLRALVGAVLMGAAGLAWAGGQQITAEVSADGKAVVVRTYRCGTPATLSVTGTADGVVKGERRSMTLEVARASEPGVFTVSRQWPAEGTWVLTFSVEGGAAANAIVELAPGPELRIASQEFSFEKPTPRRIETALKASR